MYLDDALLYNQGYMISINDLDSTTWIRRCFTCSTTIRGRSRST